MEAEENSEMASGSFQDPITWYRINYARRQATQWDFQNKGKSGWTGTSSFVFEVPLCNLRPGIIYSVPCDRILQRASLTLTSENQVKGSADNMQVQGFLIFQNAIAASKLEKCLK